MKPHHAPLALLAVFASWACSADEEDSPVESPSARSAAVRAPSSEQELEDYLIREVAAALFEDEKLKEAWEKLQPLVLRPSPAPEDLLRSAIVRFARNDLDGAAADLARVREPLAEDPALHYNLGLVSYFSGEFEQARVHYERAHELAPDDYPTELALANTLAELDLAELAEPHYRTLLEHGFLEAGTWHLTTLHRFFTLMMRLERMEAADAARLEKAALEARGHKAPQGTTVDRGNFGRLLPPAHRRTEIATPAPPSPLSPGPVHVALLAEISGFETVDLGTNWPRPPAPAPSARPSLPGSGAAPLEARAPDPGPTGVVAWGPEGARMTRLGADAEPPMTVATGATGKVDHVEPLDLENDGDLDFLLVRGSELQLVTWNGAGWAPLAIELPRLPSPVLDAVALDFDHEGDLDLLVVGAFGFRLIRNDGAGRFFDPETGKELDPPGPGVSPEQLPPRRAGRFTDATAETELPTTGAFAWCVTEDFDGDQDVDFLLGGPDGVLLADSLRGGRFADRSARLPDGLASATPPLVADLDGDRFADLVLPGAEGRAFANVGDGTYRELADWRRSAPVHAGRPRLFDLDLDGSADLVWDGSGAAGEVERPVWLAAGLAAATSAVLRGGDQAAGPLEFGDLDGDGELELVTVSGGDVRSAEPAATGHHHLKLVLVGDRDNQNAIGAVVEVRAGPIYRRIYWRGRSETVGLGERTEAEVVRITWPNGVVQDLVHVYADTTFVVAQKPGDPGSCPFLYTWNGATYEFIGDVLGITPLGLPMAPGLLVPPDHDEFVLVRGEQLVPRELEDGARVLELQITEELREVTYLDRLRLDVVDHPLGTDVYPNERFCFPPFPEAHTHTVRDPLAPTRVTGSDGRDWTAALAAIDDELARPFEEHKGQFPGLAPPHWLELEFDAEALADAELLRLLCTGWLYWSNASSNVAAARTDGVDFVPPTLLVPDADGGWREAGAPVGFPAGKPKTMVLDVTDLLDPADPRLRIASTLCLYWDSVRLAVDGDDAPLRVTSLEPRSAELWDRGFSRPLFRNGRAELEWFDWEQVTERPRWNQHPGLYTRYGETASLLKAIDDRFVILGAGDALHVRFSAEDLPALPDGWRRDYLLFLDGWAKDRDPNTHEALYVEPLPFHGMSGYPYGPDEAFPDTEEHRAWRREWNTRPGRHRIEPLAPERRPPILLSTAGG